LGNPKLSRLCTCFAKKSRHGIGLRGAVKIPDGNIDDLELGLYHSIDEHGYVTNALQTLDLLLCSLQPRT